MRYWLIHFVVLCAANAGRYERQRVIGRGANALVWLAFDKTGEYDEVVIKCARTESAGKALENEFEYMNILYEVSSDRFPKPIEAIDNNCPERQRGIVMESLGKDLARIPPSSTISISRIAEIGLFMMKTVNIMHSAGYTHGDAHAGNWLLPQEASFADFLVSGSPMSLKLIDLGTVQPIDEVNLLTDFNFVFEALKTLALWAEGEPNVEEFIQFFRPIGNTENLSEYLLLAADYLESLVAYDASNIS
jgi:serine/threonine protein kinase